MFATCPHCQNEIDLLEPKDLDELGLTPNIRGPLIKSGDLKVWATLRGGKFFLFLRSEVRKTQRVRSLKERERLARSASTSQEEYEKVFAAIEKALADSDGVEPSPPVRRTPRRKRG